jgi:UDP-N-acetylglucosamine 2-epimerase (non-hydrolysing)
MKFCIVLGTRPEIIKMSPIIRECLRRDLDYFIIHTGQHYSYDMDRIFFENLKLPDPKYNLDVGSGSHGVQTARMLASIEEILRSEMPDIVYVQGDTNTVLAGALAASKLHIKIGHVEAGLRSYDRTMPEEINRIVADHISDLLFTPTEDTKAILLKEGIPEEKISVTGNTIVDAVYEDLEIARSSGILQRLGLDTKKYLLATVHRQENADDRTHMVEILEGLGRISADLQLPAILPLHPRTKKMIATYGLAMPANVIVIEPLGFMDFLCLEANARLALTDSGGVQEECCILNVPCVTLRDNTERPETIHVGANVLAGYHSDDIFASAKAIVGNDKVWRNPFGDGDAGKIIMETSIKALGN